MDTFLLDSNYSILFEWLKLQLSDYEEKSDQWAFSLCQIHNHCKVYIRFYHSGVIEEVIKRTEDDQILYYIHFQFYNFLQSTNILKDSLIFVQKINNEKKHILICCSCGLTSSLFQEGMQNLIDENKLNLDITASDIYSLENKYQDYDFILLAPQVNHIKPQLMKTIKKPIITIPPNDFACHHYLNILSIINNYLGEEQ